MSTHSDKFKLGTADSVLLAVGTLAVDFICTSKNEIVEVQPGGKKLVHTKEELKEKIKRYGITKGPHYPGSSIGNFVNQAQLLTLADEHYAPVHLATAMAIQDPLAKVLLKSLDDKGVQYSITEFDAPDAANPVALLVESKAYTKIISFKDKRFPPIEVNDPEGGEVGLVIVGAAAGHAVESKQNALTYALKHKLPLGMTTTEGEINELTKNKALKSITEEILKNASFLACNEDEVRKILLAEKPGIKLSREPYKQAIQLREVFNNPNLNILLSLGAEGSLFLFDDTVVIQKVPEIDHKEVVSTAGAGDTLAGAFVQGIRMKGMDVEGVCWALPRANRAAQNVLRYADTRSGQFDARQFLEEPSKDFETEALKI